MKIINSDLRFSGFVIVNNKEIYIDTYDGKGFPEIFDNMKGIIINLTKFGKTIVDKMDFEDVYQEVCLFILEGILKYKADKNAALSTFLYIYVKNNLIDLSREKKECFQYSSENIYNSKVLVNIDLNQRTKMWDNRWKNIIFKIFVKGESINDIAIREGMTGWGLSRAIRRKFKEAQKI